MASKPPSGASRLPDIFSFWSSLLKKSKLLVSLMTFRKENGGSLSGHGCLSLRRRKEDGQKMRGRKKNDMFIYNTLLYACEYAPQSVHVLLGGSHVSLGLDHFVHKLSKPNGVVIWQLLHQRSYSKHSNISMNATTYSTFITPHNWQREAHPALCPSSSGCPNRRPWSWRSPWEYRGPEGLWLERTPPHPPASPPLAERSCSSAVETLETAEASCWFVASEREKTEEKFRFSAFWSWNIIKIRLKYSGMTDAEMWVMKTYSFYLHAALSCDYSCSTAAMRQDILVQVTARAIKGLNEQEVWSVRSDFSTLTCRVLK